MYTNTGNDSKSTSDDLKLDPAKTPIYVGKGVTINGDITLDASQDEGLRVFIAGNFNGNIYAPNGIVQIGRGALVNPSKEIVCRHFVCAGKVRNTDAVLRAKKVSLEDGGSIALNEVHVEQGQVAQSLGSVINARIVMPEADDAEVITPTPFRQVETRGEARPAVVNTGADTLAALASVTIPSAFPSTASK